MLQRFFQMYGVNIVSLDPGVQFMTERSDFMVFYMHTTLEKYINY